MHHAPGAVTPLNPEMSRSVTPSGIGRSGAACFRVRCGRWVLQKSSYSRSTIIRCRWFQIRVRSSNSLARDTTSRRLNDAPARVWSARSEIVQRLLADECELCGSRKQVEVHHIRALKNLSRNGKGNPPEWAKRMAARRRKTLVSCRV
jgi:hypothetical protein